MKLKTWLVIVIPIIVVSVSLLTTFLSRQFMMNLSNNIKFLSRCNECSL